MAQGEVGGDAWATGGWGRATRLGVAGLVATVVALLVGCGSTDSIDEGGSSADVPATTPTVRDGLLVECGGAEFTGAPPDLSLFPAAVDFESPPAAPADGGRWAVIETSESRRFLLEAPVDRFTTETYGRPLEYQSLEAAEGAWVLLDRSRCVATPVAPGREPALVAVPPGVRPDRDATSLDLWVLDDGCRSDFGEQLELVIYEDPTHVGVAASVGAGASCARPRWVGQTVGLADPLGDRSIVDYAAIPGIIRTTADQELQATAPAPS